MFYYWKKYLLILLLFLPFLGQTQNLRAIPELNAPVMDTAQMMSAEKRNQLNQQLLDYSNTSGSQIAVLTVDKIRPESPFDYASRVFDSWKLGRKDINDGVLLLIVRDERKTHIAVGSGLEGAIPDAYAKRILSEIVAPNFRADNVNGGIIQAVEQIKKLIAGEELPPSNAIKDEIFKILATIVFYVTPISIIIIRAIYGVIKSILVGFSCFFLIGLLVGNTLEDAFWNGVYLGLPAILFLNFLFSMGSRSKGASGNGVSGSSGGGGSSSSYSGGGGSSSGGGASGGW